MERFRMLIFILAALAATAMSIPIQRGSANFPLSSYEAPNSAVEDLDIMLDVGLESMETPNEKKAKAKAKPITEADKEIQRSKDSPLNKPLPDNDDDIVVTTFAGVIMSEATETQLRIFQFDQPEEGAIPNLILAPRGEVPWTKKIEPGLVFFENHPDEAGTILRPLLEYMSDKVPSAQHNRTSLIIKCDQAMRDLNSTTRQRIMDSARRVAGEYGFLFKPEFASVMTGAEEASYAWITTNYVHDFLNSSGNKTINRGNFHGILDMETRTAALVAFMPSKNQTVDDDMLLTLDLFGTNYTLYAHAYMGYGVREARSRQLSRIVNQAIKQNVTKIKNPCNPKGVNSTYFSERRNKVFKITGTGNYEECKAAMVKDLNATKPCKTPPCGFNGVSQPTPPVDKVFYALSDYFHVAHFLDLEEDNSTLDQWEAGSKEVCEMEWDDLVSAYSLTNDQPGWKKRLKVMCIASVYLRAVMVDGIGMTSTKRVISFINEFGSGKRKMELALYRGALIHHLSQHRDDPLIFPSLNGKHAT